jgi:hypothetical protein
VLGLAEETVEFWADRIEGGLRLLRAVMNQWAALGIDHVAEEAFHRGFLTEGHSAPE